MVKTVKRPDSLPDLSCDENRAIMDRMEMDVRSVSREEADAYAIHLSVCPECAEAFYLASGMNGDGTFKQEDLARFTEIEPLSMTLEEGLQDLLRRCPELAEAYRREMHKKRVRRPLRRLAQVAALAAAVFLVASLFLWPHSARGRADTSNAPATKSGEFVSGTGNTTHSSPPVKRSTDDLLGELHIDAPLPSVEFVDLEQVEYAAWRDEHRDWFAQQFPWIFSVKAAVQSDRAVAVDYIELLMVSGDIWQFHCDPIFPLRQPLAKLEPMAILRLVQCYHMDAGTVLRDLGVPASRLAASPVWAQKYAEALRQWHGALNAMGHEKIQGTGDIAMFSLDAGCYLANTRAAAFLWSKAHPQEARKLLADSGCNAMKTSAPLALAGDGCIQRLKEQALAARSIAQAALILVTMPMEDACAPQLVKQRRILADMVAALASNASVSMDRPSEGIGQ